MAISVIARGQITIKDYNDAVSLVCYVGSNQALSQIYTEDGQTYAPNWATGTFLKLTPELYKSGDSSNIMTAGSGVQSVTWTSGGTPVVIDATHIKNVAAPYDLTIKVNELSSTPAKNYECTIVWRDPNTNLDITVKSAITFTKVVNAGALICAIAYTPNGSVFKNDGVSSLKAHCDFWRGAGIDAANVSYSWHIMVAGTWSIIDATHTYSGITGYTSNEITIPSASVLNFETFRCTIKDTDAASVTVNKTVIDIVSFSDVSDPIAVDIEASNGDTLRNGSGSTTLKAILWRAGIKIDTAGTGYTYEWIRFKEDGVLDGTWGTTGSKLGQSVTIVDADVNGKATFYCNIKTLV